MKPSDVEFDCVRSAIYHGARMHFLDRLNRWMMFFVIAGGTATMASLLKVTLGIPPEWFASLTTIISAANIAFGFSSRARDHDFLRRQYYGLLAKLVEGRAESDIAEKIHCEVLRLSATEPPPLRALDAVAYNAALESLGRDKAFRLKITWWQSLCRHFYPFNGTKFAPVAV